MNESPRCLKCGIALPADAPAGLCPQCLVQAGFESQPVSGDHGATKLTPPNSGFEPPTVEELAPLFPQLEILELLGKGGMGAVYKARQPGLDRLVALKILPPEISRDPAFAERFQREARALARLNHPHIVAVFDFGQTSVGWPPLAVPRDENADGQGRPSYFIVMEFVDGANLRQAIQAGKLAAAEALAIVPQICEALQFAHDEGIVHRDIKPENILIDKRGRVKIADFGLAKLLGTDATDHSLTATHQVMGTLRYMAPEQMQGSREVDHRADIYSLGVVFYELLTGELPMGKFAPPSKKVQVDVRLDEIVLRALEQEPEQRYQHASQIKSDVESVSSTPIVLSSAKSGAPPQRPVLADRSDARLSRCALVGAIWAPLFFIAFIAAFVPMMRSTSYAQGEYTGPQWWQLALAFTLLPLGVLAPFGTTILGAIGITKIKRSEGKLYGLRLAQADALLFPLLVLGVGAFLAVLMLLRGPLRGLPPVSSGLDEWFYQSPHHEFLALLIALPIWFFPARALFRAVVGPRDAFDLRKLPLVGDEPLTGKAALVVALAAIAAHAWPWHWIITPPPIPQRSATISNFDVIDALQSFWLLVGSIGLALFASAATLARPAKLILRIGSVIAVIAALVIQVQFFRSLGEYEPGQPTVVRLIRTYSHMGVYVTMALTGLAILLFLLRIFDEPSQPRAAEASSRAIGPEQISFWAAISGVLLPALLLLGGTVMSSRDSIPDAFVVVCFLPGVGLELVAFGCGLVARGTKSGKAGLIIASISLVLCPIPLTTGLRTRVSTEERQPESMTKGESVAVEHADSLPMDAPLKIDELLTLKGHTGYVYNVRFSPDGTRIASASHDGTAKVWNAETGEELVTCRGHTGLVHGLAYSSDGTRIATTSEDGSIRIWNATTGEQILETTGGHTRGASNLAFSPNGERVASVSLHDQVKVWDSKTGDVLLTCQGRDNSVFFNVAYSPDGKWLAASGFDGAVWLWDATTGREADIHLNAVSQMHGLAFSRDSSRLSACSSDQHVRVWDVQTGELLILLKLMEHSPLCVAFSPDGQWLANGTTNGDIRIWHATKEAPVYVPPARYREALTVKAHPRQTKSVAFNHDGTRLASGSDDKTVKVWKVTPKDERRNAPMR